MARISLTALIAGFITLSLELLGFRALAPYFGYSIYVFGALIGLVLLSMSVGYAWGGALGSRIKQPRFALIAAAASVYIGLAGAFHETILAFFGDMPLAVGAFAGALLIFGPPMFIFAAASPYLVGRLNEKGATAAGGAGKISFWSTIGGLAGTIATSFFLLPLLGVKAMFILNAALGLVAAWLLGGSSIVPIAGLAIIAFLATIPSAAQAGVIHSENSPYSLLEVADFGKFIGLRTERRSGTVYSVAPKSGHWDYSFELYNFFAAPPHINGGKNILLLGLGAGTIPLMHEAANPDVKITGVEIDPQIVALGKKYFGMDRLSNLAAISIGDARPYLQKSGNKFDVIEMDLFRGGTEIPFYLTTKEFFALTAGRLSENGILAMNIYDPFPNSLILRSISASAGESYPYVYTVRAGQGSFFVMASKNPIDASRLNSDDPKLGKVFADLQKNIRQTTPEKNLILTDDKAPLEKFYGSPF